MGSIFKRPTREHTGRYTVYLSFKAALKGCPLPIFNHTDYNALSRLKNVETKCKRNLTFGKLYEDFIKEYEELGHLVKQGKIHKIWLRIVIFWYDKVESHFWR